MQSILGIIGGVPQSNSRNDDDFSDRLSHRYTTAVFVTFAVIVSTKQYVGTPISCWTPAHFTGNWQAYANQYCWVRNTYYLPFEEYIPKEHEDDQRHVITYYQWMPIILLLQALMFYMPCMIWRNLNSRSGIDINSIIETGETFQNAEKAHNREKSLDSMTRQMDRYLMSQKSNHQTGCTVSMKYILSHTCFFFCGRRRGNYLVSVYIFSKLIYIANVIGQLFILNIFLGHQFSIYGIDVLRSLASGEDWTASPRFPRVTMCDFKIRVLGNLQRYTVQCVLPINLFNEKIYLFVWCWMVFVAAIACFSLLTWSLSSIFRGDRHRYIKKYLHVMEKLKRDEDKKNCTGFIDKYLKQDGVFVLRLLGHNTNSVTVTEFVCSLWDNYIEKARAANDPEADM